MKRRYAVFAVVFAVSMLIGIQAVEVVDANPIPWAFNPQMSVSILSPQNGTISSLPVLVSFTSKGDVQFSVSDDPSEGYVRSFFYVLDGQDMETGIRFEGTKTTIIYDENGSRQGFQFDGQANLTNLAGGPHNITIYYGAVNKISYVGTPQEQIIFNPAWQATAQFYVDSKLDSGLTITPSPSPSQSMPTINTGPRFQFELNPSAVYISLAIVIVMVVVASVLFFGLNRKKKHSVIRVNFSRCTVGLQLSLKVGRS
jgi:hypothetical protein